MNHEKLQLREPIITPTSEMVALVLGESYAAYEAFQEALPALEIEQQWQWYTPHKAWFAKGQHRWVTSRGANKEKTLYWLHFFDGYFSVAVWFKEKNRMEALKADVSEQTRQLISEANTMGKMPTFPVIFDITTAEPLKDVCTLIECKKILER
ncbi:MAG: DUF3788 domain-containing protein [Oscillospiraceae bacterium]|nr:DUF3788 domain-containing protein [Oscillospiraceae bacterium]